MFWEERVFSHVGCLSLSGLIEISEAGRSLTEKAEQERKRLQNVYIFVWVTIRIQNVRERVRVVSGSHKGERERERESSWKTRVYIGNPCHSAGTKCAGQNQSCGRSCKH